jgi:hypothetical protein
MHDDGFDLGIGQANHAADVPQRLFESGTRRHGDRGQACSLGGKPDAQRVTGFGRIAARVEQLGAGRGRVVDLVLYREAVRRDAGAGWSDIPCVRLRRLAIGFERHHGACANSFGCVRIEHEQGLLPCHEQLPAVIRRELIHRDRGARNADQRRRFHVRGYSDGTDHGKRDLG